jgi:sulfatase maturation enzyme AslB (radical SAM superfamily)
MPRCNALTNHICLDTDVRFRPCCVFLKTQDAITAGELPWSEYRSSDFYKDVERQMEFGWHPNCEGCRLDEELGRTSTRMLMNTDLSGVPDFIEDLDICLSNECNLSCKMCSPAASTRWEKVIEKNTELSKYWYYQPNTYANRNVKDVVSAIDFTNVKNIKLIGGEPFIGNHLASMIDLIKQQTSIDQIRLTVSTNCTVFPKDIIDDFVKFKFVIVCLSVDGMGDLCDYIRTGRPWNKVSPVIDKWIDLAKHHSNIHLTVCFTLQALNIHQYKTVKEWAEKHSIDFNCELLKTPSELSIYSLPDSYINDLEDTGVIDDYLSNLLSADQRHSPLNLLDLVLSQDKAVGTDITLTVPELYQSLKSQIENK